MKNLRVLLPFATALMISAVVEAGHHSSHLGGVIKQLDLSDDQRADLRRVFKQSRLDKQLYKTDVRAIDEQLKSVIHAAQWNAQEAERLLLEKQTIRSQSALTRVTNRHYLWHNLSEAQQQKFTELMSRKRSDNKHADRKSRSPMAKFSKLNLTDEQQNQIESVLVEQKSQLKQWREARKTVKQQEAMLIKADEFDHTGWQKVHQQQQKINLQLAKSHAYTRHQIWQLLDQQQQTKMQELSGKRRHKHRHKTARS